MSRGPQKRNRPAQRGPNRAPLRSRSASSRGEKKVKTREAPAGRLTGRAIVLLSVVLLLLASYTSSLHTWWSQHQEIESTKAAIASKKARIAELEDTRKRLDDDAYIEQQARRRFGWVMPGEVGYRVIGVDGKIEGDVPELAEPTGSKPREWYAKLWGTVNEADKEPARESRDADKVLKDK